MVSNRMRSLKHVDHAFNVQSIWRRWNAKFDVRFQLNIIEIVFETIWLRAPRAVLQSLEKNYIITLLRRIIAGIEVHTYLEKHKPLCNSRYDTPRATEHYTWYITAETSPTGDQRSRTIFVPNSRKETMCRLEKSLRPASYWDLRTLRILRIVRLARQLVR